MCETAESPETSSGPAAAGPISDEEALERIRAGETAFYEVLMQRHHRLLHYVARGIVRDEAEAEDVVQDAHLRAFMHLGQFAGRSSFGTWLTRITVNEALSRKRRPAPRPSDEVPLAESGLDAVLASPQPDPEQRACAAELRARLQAALNKLPARYRAVFTMREIDELSTLEAARRLGVSDACVKTRLHRAKNLLREKFRPAAAPPVVQ